jgi:hypothetical protein
VVKCYSVQDARNAGLDGKHEDETANVSTLTVTHIGATGDVYSFYVQELYGPPVLLCTYTQVSGDSTVTLLAASISTAINNNAANNGGYNAVPTVGAIAITARAGLGAILNGTVTATPYTIVTTSGSFTATTTAQGASSTTPGVGSKFDIYYYHIHQYFDVNPGGILYVGIYPVLYTFTEPQTMEGIATAGNGPQINQFGLYVDGHSFTTGDITTLEAIKTTMGINHTPASFLFQGDNHATADVGSLVNLSGLSGTGIGALCGQDGGAYGNLLYNAYGKSIGNLGAALGALSLGSVASDFAQPIPSNNLSQVTITFPICVGGVIGTNVNSVPENSIPAFDNGQLFMPIYATSGSKLTQLDNYRWIYIGQYAGYVGTFLSENQTCTLSNASIAYLNDDRVTNKIQRLLYPAYLPYLKSEIILNANGTISNTSIPVLTSAGQNALNVMLANNELSATSVIINPNQNITASGKLVVTLFDVETAIARNIEIDINTVNAIPTV